MNRKNSWLIEALKGLIAIIVGIICFANPSGALSAIAVFFGIVAIIAGLIIAVNVTVRRGSYWQFWLGEGIFNLVLGVLLVAYPKVAVNLIIIFIALWIIALSILQIISYNILKREGFRSPVVLFTAILSLVIGLLLLFNPFEGAAVVVIIIGIFAFIYGLSSFYVSFRLLNR